MRYLAGLKEPPKGYRVWGTADSEAAHFNYSQKITSGEQVTVNEVKEVFAATVDREVDAYGGDIEWADGETAATIKDSGVKLAALYHTQAAPLVQPIASEAKIEFTVPGVPVPVIGYIDVETAGEVIERKTAKAKFRGGRPDGNYLAQGRVYQLAQRKAVHWHVSTKTKLPAVYTPVEEPNMRLPFLDAEQARTEAWILATVRAIAADYRTFGDAPWPGSEALRDAPCLWCGFGPNGSGVCPWP